MISYLNIKNIALIRDLSLSLKGGLNILSGETGAGKSIIIDSINFVLGDRADRSLIRYGENMARVEVVFDKIINYDEIKRTLEDAGIDFDDGTVIVSRLMTADRSECRINGRIVNLGFLRSVVGSLVDIHSQNEHQSLMKPANHILLLDAFSDKIEENKNDYRKLLKDYREVCTAIDGFMSADERARKLDVLNYQIEEIERVNWCDESEEETLNADKTRFYNAQKITDSVAAAKEALDDESVGGVSAIKNAMSGLRTALRYDTSLQELYDRLESLLIECEDVSDALEEKLEDGSDEINIEQIEKRLGEIKSLRRKYGSDIEEIAEFLQKAKEEAQKLTDAEELLEDLTAKKENLEKKILSVVDTLHELRTKVAKKFSASICKNLDELGMKNSRFEVAIDYPEKDEILNNLNANGADVVEFMLSPNVGEPLKPLSKIASGGETSRFMLALKNIIAEVDMIGTLIFDEIDTGISGVIAKVVAKKLYDIATARQVIAITHLPQLASMADVNYLISKRVVGENTVTEVAELGDEAVYKEIMRLTGAVENSETGLAGAKELKEWANAYKSTKLK